MRDRTGAVPVRTSACEVVPTSRTGARTGDVEDLDDDAGWVRPPRRPVPSGAPAPAAPCRTRTRSLAVAAAVAVLAGGGVAHAAGAGVPVLAGEDPAALASQVRIPVGAVQGTPRVGTSGTSSTDGGSATGAVAAGGAAGAWSRFAVLVPVVNLGKQPVRVTVLGVDAPHQRTARVPAPVEVPPGTARTVVLQLEVRCADVPPPGPPRSGTGPGTGPGVRPDAVVLGQVIAPGSHGSIPVRRPWAEQDGTTFFQQLWSVCVPRQV